eukprot:jgi/Undpi1/12890/HiC_scaffold_7.g02556.m1
MSTSIAPPPPTPPAGGGGGGGGGGSGRGGGGGRGTLWESRGGSRGGGGGDGIPRSSFMQVPLSLQSEQLSRGRKVFEELSSFAKEKFQVEDMAARSSLRASQLSAPESEFHQPLEQAMGRHAELVMRAKVGVQRSGQLVQESEARLAKAKRTLARAQGEEKVRGGVDPRGSAGSSF